MTGFKHAKRFRTIAVALAITFAANYAISVSGAIDHQSSSSSVAYASTSRSGGIVPPPPKP